MNLSRAVCCVGKECLNVEMMRISLLTYGAGEVTQAQAQACRHADMGKQARTQRQRQRFTRKGVQVKCNTHRATSRQDGMGPQAEAHRHRHRHMYTPTGKGMQARSTGSRQRVKHIEAQPRSRMQMSHPQSNKHTLTGQEGAHRQGHAGTETQVKCYTQRATSSY